MGNYYLELYGIKNQKATASTKDGKEFPGEFTCTKVPASIGESSGEYQYEFSADGIPGLRTLQICDGAEIWNVDKSGKYIISIK